MKLTLLASLLFATTVNAAVVGHVPYTVLVAPKAGLSTKEFEKAIPEMKHAERIGQSNTYVVKLKEGHDTEKVMKRLSKDRRFKYAELDAIVSPDLVVNDPSIGSSWMIPKIQAPTAWDTSTGDGVTIAILDSGMLATHPDLAANYVPGWNFYDNTADTTDLTGHGTLVAGTAAMVGNNAAGSAGVAFNAKIMPLRVTEPVDGYGYYSMMANALYYSADRGARVANMSFAGVAGSSTIFSASDYFRSKGGVVTVSAGNTGAENLYPPSNSVIAVSATGTTDVRASWSSWGNYVDVAAPGVSIYTTNRTGGYSNASGTSFSAPTVAGLAALVIATNPALSPTEIDEIVINTTDDIGTLGWDVYYGSGRVNASKAVALASTYTPRDTLPPTVKIVSPTGGAVEGIVPVNITYTDNVGVVKVDMYVNNSLYVSEDTSPFAFVWDTTGLPRGNYSLKMLAHDAAGNVGTSNVVTVQVGADTVAPTITSFNLRDGQLVSPTKQTITAAATDDVAVTRMELFIGTKLVKTGTTSINYVWNTRKVKPGNYVVTVTAVDAAGNHTSKSVIVTR